MDEREVRVLVAQLLTDRERCREVADDALRRAAGIEAVISGYLQMYPGLADEFELPFDVGEMSPREGEAPRGAAAVRIILQESPRKRWVVSELVDELRRRSWLPKSDNPANAVRAALERLLTKADSDVFKTPDKDERVVYYVYDPDRDPELFNPLPDDPPAGWDDEDPF